MQFSIVDVASVFLSVSHYPRKFNIPQKNKTKQKQQQQKEQNKTKTKDTNELGPAWQNIAGNHCISWQKKIAFSYSDPGDSLENKLDDLKSLYSRKKSFAFQKKLKKILLHWRVILPTRINSDRTKMRATYYTWPLSMKQTFDRHMSILFD